MGLSSHPAGGYDKWTQAGDIRAVLDKLGIDGADIVAHDIGTMVAYAYARVIRTRRAAWTVMDSPIPGIPPWNQIVRLPASWHFNFGGPDAERLVAGRERIYPRPLLERVRRRPVEDRRSNPPPLRRDLRQARRDAFRVRPVPRDRPEGRGRQPQGDGDELAMPVLAIGAEKAFGANVAAVMRNAATNVQELIVPNAGHWLMEEAPAATIAAVQDFLAAH